MAERGVKVDHSTNACWVLHYGRILNERIGCEMRSHNQSWRVEETLCSRRPPLYLSVSAAEGFLRLALSLGRIRLLTPQAHDAGQDRFDHAVCDTTHNVRKRPAAGAMCLCSATSSGRLQSFPMSLRLEPYLYSWSLEWTGFALDQEGCKSVFPRCIHCGRAEKRMTGDNRRFQYFAFGVNRYFERSRAFHVSLPGQFGINNRLLMNKPLKPVLLTYPDCVARWRRITGLWIRVSRRRLEHVL